MLRKLLGLRFRDYLYCLWPALLCSAAMFVALFGACVVRFMFKLPDLWYLTFAVPLGAVTYGWVFWRLDPQAFQELWQIGQRLVSIRFNAKVA